jgi:site-specific DNA-methyltransferase (adenine-specific)
VDYSKLTKKQLNKMKILIIEELNTKGIVILPPMDVSTSLSLLRKMKLITEVVILDPWYNVGKGKIIERNEYDKFIKKILKLSCDITRNIYLWGFPQIVARYVDYAPKDFIFKEWITWYYKNAPSRKKGWRPSQNSCLYFAKEDAIMYPENFMNEKQLELKELGKLTFIPGPTTVIEEPLLVGFIGKNEQTGHPSQKPVNVFSKIILMSTKDEDLIFDPMCGSGTTGEAALANNRKVILCDENDEYISMTEKRLCIERLDLSCIE